MTDLIFCVDLFTHQPTSYRLLNKCVNIHHFKSRKLRERVEMRDIAHAQSLTEIQDLNKHNCIIQRFVK